MNKSTHTLLNDILANGETLHVELKSSFHLSNLQKENRLKRVGGRKEGYWEVLDV